jgi:deaminated glutathione amidase
VIRVRLVQFAATTDHEDNLATVTRLLGRPSAADDDHESLVVLPEAAMHDFGPPDSTLGPVAQPLDGPFVTGLADLARKHRATVVAGVFEASDDEAGRPYNTLVVVSPDGELTAAYRKIHLYDSFGYRESDRLLAGDPTPVVVPVGDRTLGLVTCYDLRFPEHARALVDAGADLFVVPAAWLAGPLKEDHWETLLRARAIENTVHVAAAGQCGRAYSGRSMIIDPLGVVIGSAGSDEGVVHGDVTIERLNVARERNPALLHRRLARPST